MGATGVTAREVVTGYIEEIASGRVPANRALVGWAVESLPRLEAWLWGPLEEYSSWVAEYVTQATGSNFGQPLVLLPWQLALAAQLLCDPDCRALLVVVARGAGKTELAASLVAWVLLHDGPGRQYFSVAPTQRSASIVFERLRSMIQGADPGASASETMAIGSTGGWIRSGGSTYRALPCTATAMDGLAARMIVADEVARMDRALGRVLTGLSKDARSQLLCITTPDAQQRRQPIWAYWSQLHLHYTTGSPAPVGWRAMLYGLDADDDALEQEHWIKAQPSLGRTVSLGAMRASIEAMLSTHDAEQIAECDMQVLCRHNDRLSSALDLAILDRCMSHQIDWAALAGAPAVIGIDLAKGAPIATHANLSSAMLAVWDAKHSRICMRGMHWWAGRDISASERRSHQPLRRWVAEGQLRVMGGETHDMGTIELQVQAWAAVYSVRHVGVDPISHQESHLIEWRRRGIPITAVEQGIRTMGPAWALWTDGITSQRIVHQPDDVLRECLSATRTIADNAGNVRPVKGRSASNIDAVVAACMAAVLVEKFQIARASGYEQPGGCVL